LKKLKIKKKTFQGSEMDMTNGGECLIFEVLDELKQALPTNVAERILPKIRPDFLRESHSDEALLEFIILKLVHKVARKGINFKQLFSSWDKDGNGHLDTNEIIQGVRNVLGVDFSREECQLMLSYLDKDCDGTITYDEFAMKISFFDYEKKEEKYLISLKTLSDYLMNEWYTLRG